MKKKILFYMLALILFFSFIFGFYKTFKEIKGYRESIILYEDTEKIVIENPVNENEENILKVNFKKLKSINKNVIGWIYMKHLNISYPIVQGKDNDYYLTHLINHSSNKSGSIFLDYRNNKNFTDKHSIIYGHNMYDKTMFSNLTKYDNTSFYKRNPYYYLITEEYVYKIDIIASYITEINQTTWSLDFNNEKSIQTWLDYTLNNSLIETDVEVSIDNQFITLSTCTYEFEDARFVLVGIISEKTQ